MEEITMIEEKSLPLYEVEEVTLEQAILLLASENEKEQSIYRESTERMLHLCV